MGIEAAGVLIIEIMVDERFRGIDPDGLELMAEMLGQSDGINGDVVMVID